MRGDDTLRKSRRIDGLPDAPQELIEWAQETAGPHDGGGNLSGLDTVDMPPEPIVLAFDGEAAALFDEFERELIGLRQQQLARDLLACSLESSLQLCGRAKDITE